MKSRAFVLILALALPATAADLTVGPAGSGATFDSLGSAVTAAAPGDRIFVQAAWYTEPAGILIDKPLTILGSGSLWTRINFPSSVGMEVQGLHVGSAVEVVGLTISAHKTAFEISGCMGPVSFADCSAEYVGSGSNAGFHADSSDHVLLDSCSASAVSGEFGVAAIRASNSTMHLVGGVYDGSPSVSFSGGPGLSANSSTVHISRAVLRGGMGGLMPAMPYSIPNPSGSGIDGVASQIHVRGGAINLIEGGPPASADWSHHGIFYGDPGHGIELDAASSLSLTPDALVLGGASPIFQVPALDVLGSLTNEPEAFAVLGVNTRTPSPGDLITLAFEGEPGAAVIGFLALDLIAPLSFTGLVGPLQVDPTQILVLPTEFLDATGQALTSFDVPAWPSLVGETFYLQGLGWNASGTLSASSPLLIGVVP